jgi:hypothetical protein
VEDFSQHVWLSKESSVRGTAATGFSSGLLADADVLWRDRA